MGKKGHSEEELLRVLREAESGDTVGGGLPQAWRQSTDVLPLEEEVCRAGLERAAPATRGELQAQAVGRGPQPGPAHFAGDCRKKAVKPRRRRELAEWAQPVRCLRQRRLGLIPVERGTLRYQQHRDPQDALRVRRRELAGSRVRYGYRRLTVLLKREGWEVNAKRIYRLYTEEGLIVHTKRRKERAQRQRVALGAASRPNQRWSMDFVAQRLAGGRWIRALTVVDQFTRECLCLHADDSLSGEEVATALDRGGEAARCSPVDHRRQRHRVR